MLTQNLKYIYIYKLKLCQLDPVSPSLVLCSLQNAWLKSRQLYFWDEFIILLSFTY